MVNREHTNNNSRKRGNDADQYTAYSALDIAQILVRNPDELTDLLTYDYMCEKYGKGRAFEDMPEQERKAMLSLDAAAAELRWLGFTRKQVDVFVQALKNGLRESGFSQIEPDIGVPTFRERFAMTAYAIAAFPYLPMPPLAATPDYPLKSRGFSMSHAQKVTGNLTSCVAALIFEQRESNPYLLCVPYKAEGYPDQTCAPLHY